MRAVFKRRISQLLLGAGLSCIVTAWAADQSAALVDEGCDRPVYLTFDTGHMGVAPFVSEVLSREKIQATFFIANEPTQTGGMSLDEAWAPWWKKMAEQGHAFASHTFDHVYWLADLPENQFKVRPSSGPDAGKTQTWSAQQYCDELARVDARFEQMTGHKTLPLFRAPGGKTSPDLIQAGASCGYAHVGWSPAGFLGDELPSAKYPNAVLLERALKNIRTGDILMAHLGIWSRQDAWAPAVLEPLVEGLKQKGFCFATMAQHPDYREWVKKYARSPALEAQDNVRPAEPPVDAEQEDAAGVGSAEPADFVEISEPGLQTDAATPESATPRAPEQSIVPEPEITLLDISTENKTQHE